ncbi:response regulator [Sphingomonas qomolangmaensis]|uniref:Response regulator n=1 Tax=Sphingomonas qomolangmaensis TaxID=2918765 RepID=A0ABY5LA07_9SPHN|nr:response regulator [Sphingomonas qomolangmaensis]UUL83799.1 response regulator [Sphingomonas qomolangmaensis]
MTMCHALIIEDEWVIAEYLALLAEDAGATSVAIAFTENEAVLAAHDHKPDIILSDVILTAGTGPCAVRTIISELGEIPVIFITATPSQCYPRKPSSVVFDKPFAAADVTDMFRRLAHL